MDRAVNGPTVSPPPADGRERLVTGHDRGLAQLVRLCDAMGPEAPRDAILACFRDAAPLCGARSLAAVPRWSALTDDCTPFEFSVALGDGPPGLRILLEAQDDPACPATYWHAGRRLTAWLASRFEVALDRIARIEELFAPEDPAAYWSLWHSIDFRDGQAPRVKVYFNPRAQGAAAADLVDEALLRLGLAGAGVPFARHRMAVLSVDVTAHRDLRAGVHIQLLHPSASELEELTAQAPSSAPGDATALLEAVAGRTDGPPLRSLFATVHLDARAGGSPVAVGLHMPVIPFCDNDGVARERVTALLERHGLPVTIYYRCLDALAAGPLAREAGIHSFVSFVRVRGRPRLSVAFGSCLYRDRYGWLALDPPGWWPSPVPGHGHSSSR